MTKQEFINAVCVLSPPADAPVMVWVEEYDAYLPITNVYTETKQGEQHNFLTGKNDEVGRSFVALET